MANIRGVCRIGDASTKFFKCTQDFALTGSPTFFIESRAAHRESDLWTDHVCTQSNHKNTYDAYLLSGSTYFLVNDLEIGRIGDPIQRGRLKAGSDAYRNATAYVKEGSDYFFVGAVGNGVTGPVYARAGKARAGTELFIPASNQSTVN